MGLFANFDPSMTAPPLPGDPDPSLPLVIAALSFGAVITGFATTKVAEASRNLALARLTQIEIAAQGFNAAGPLHGRPKRVQALLYGVARVAGRHPAEPDLKGD